MKPHGPALAALASLLAAPPVAAGPLVADAGLARYALAADQGTFLDWLDPASRAVFAAAMGGDHGGLGAYWSLLMVGAVQMRREGADSAETLWFNPLFDAGLAARWRRSGDDWVAIAASPVTGELLRGELRSAGPLVWRAGGGIKAQAEARARRSWQGARAAGWLDRDLTDAGTAALRRAAQARGGLDAMRIAPGYDDAGIMARAALVTGDEAALPADVRRGLAVTGERARLSLRPVAGFRRSDGWTMALQSPDAPMLAWLVHFADPAPGGAATIRGYQLLNLGDGR
jgi:hypothetical protein